MGKQVIIGGFGQYFKIGAMAFAALASGAIPTTIATQSAQAGNRGLTVQQAPQDQKQAPITNPVPIRAQRQTPIGMFVPRKRKGILGSIPQKHAKRRTNRLQLSKKTKRKHARRA